MSGFCTFLFVHAYIYWWFCNSNSWSCFHMMITWWSDDDDDHMMITWWSHDILCLTCEGHDAFSHMTFCTVYKQGSGMLTQRNRYLQNSQSIFVQFHCFFLYLESNKTWWENSGLKLTWLIWWSLDLTLDITTKSYTTHGLYNLLSQNLRTLTKIKTCMIIFSWILKYR